MATYIVTYDLRTPGKEYGDLWKAIAAIDRNAFRVCESVWIVTSQYSAAAVKNQLLGALDVNDALFVANCDVASWAHMTPTVLSSLAKTSIREAAPLARMLPPLAGIFSRLS